MIDTLAIANYRSLRDVVVPLGNLNVITGANGSGKSNLYRALRLLSETALGGAAALLSREGGFDSVLWAGPEDFARSVERGEHPVEGTVRKGRVSVRLGFTRGEHSYSIDFGIPMPSESLFFDPEIKRECIWVGTTWSSSAAMIDRRGPVVSRRAGKGGWTVLADDLDPFESMLTQMADPERTPELLLLRESIRSWRFYDQFRTDRGAPARQAQLGTRTPVLHHDGRDLAAAWQTIHENGDAPRLQAAVDDAFPGASVRIDVSSGAFSLWFEQHGLLRALSQQELSDGTLRYLLWIAALLTPRPPELMVLNEPETSLHPDLIPALARLIHDVSKRTQVWVVSHSQLLTTELASLSEHEPIALHKRLGETQIVGQGLLTKPTWKWPTRT